MLHHAPPSNQAQEVVQRQAIGVGALARPPQHHGLQAGRAEAKRCRARDGICSAQVGAAPSARARRMGGRRQARPATQGAGGQRPGGRRAVRTSSSSLSICSSSTRSSSSLSMWKATSLSAASLPAMTTCSKDLAALRRWRPPRLPASDPMGRGVSGDAHRRCKLAAALTSREHTLRSPRQPMAAPGMLHPPPQLSKHAGGRWEARNSEQGGGSGGGAPALTSTPRTDRRCYGDLHRTQRHCTLPGRLQKPLH